MATFTAKLYVHRGVKAFAINFNFDHAPAVAKLFHDTAIIRNEFMFALTGVKIDVVNTTSYVVRCVLIIILAF